MPHLSFADHIVIFTNATRSSTYNLFDFLSTYEKASGQQLNKQKSSFVISRRASSIQSRLVATLSGISAGSLPFKYLGYYIFIGRKRRSYFNI